MKTYTRVHEILVDVWREAQPAVIFSDILNILADGTNFNCSETLSLEDKYRAFLLYVFEEAESDLLENIVGPGGIHICESSKDLKEVKTSVGFDITRCVAKADDCRVIPATHGDWGFYFVSETEEGGPCYYIPPTLAAECKFYVHVHFQKDL